MFEFSIIDTILNNIDTIPLISKHASTNCMKIDEFKEFLETSTVIEERKKMVYDNNEKYGTHIFLCENNIIRGFEEETVMIETAMKETVMIETAMIETAMIEKVCFTILLDYNSSIKIKLDIQSEDESISAFIHKYFILINL